MQIQPAFLEAFPAELSLAHQDQRFAVDPSSQPDRPIGEKGEEQGEAGKNQEGGAPLRKVFKTAKGQLGGNGAVEREMQKIKALPSEEPKKEAKR